MRASFFVRPLLALFLSVCLALPVGPAFALKPTETQQGTGLEELDAALRGESRPATTAGLEEGLVYSSQVRPKVRKMVEWASSLSGPLGRPKSSSDLLETGALLTNAMHGGLFPDLSEVESFLLEWKHAVVRLGYREQLISRHFSYFNLAGITDVIDHLEILREHPVWNQPEAHRKDQVSFLSQAAHAYAVRGTYRPGGEESEQDLRKAISYLNTAIGISAREDVPEHLEEQKLLVDLNRERTRLQQLVSPAGLEEAITEGLISQWINQLGHHSVLDRRNAALNLGQMAALIPEETAPAVVTALTETFLNRELEVQEASAWALGQLGPRASRAVPVLEQRLGREKDQEVQQTIRDAIGRIQPPAAGLEETGATAVAERPLTANAPASAMTKEKAEQVIKGLAEGWGLNKLTELRIVAVSSEVVKTNSDFRRLVGEPVNMGNYVRLVIVPENNNQIEDQIGDIFVKLFERMPNYQLPPRQRLKGTVQAYGPNDDEALNLFAKIAKIPLVGFSILERQPLNMNLIKALREILKGLPGIDAAAIPDKELELLEKALSALA